MTRTNIKRICKAGAFVKEESGFTLIEILVASAVLAIVSLSLMGYFVTAMERSADNNHRIIAANLARMKAEELKEVFRKPLPPGSLYPTRYSQLVQTAASGSLEKVRREQANLNHGIPGLFSGLLEPYTPVDSSGGSVQATVYRFQVEIGKGQNSRLHAINEANRSLFPLSMEEALFRVIITVFWGAAGDGSPAASKSVALDTYFIGG
jgi:prepilin-type N-terminal cleavage/methylation domain-containing protein